MNKLKLMMTVAAIALTALPAAAKDHNGGYTGPSSAKDATVAEAKGMKDNSPVKLKGKIENSIGDEKYTFSDATGSIVVEIDDKIWNGQTVAPENIVIIEGEVDADWMKPTSVDVEKITVAE